MNLNIGKLLRANGDKYEGDWKDGKMNGEGKVFGQVGVYNYGNGDKYNGNWVNDEKNGNGNLI